MNRIGRTISVLVPVLVSSLFGMSAASASPLPFPMPSDTGSVTFATLTPFTEVGSIATTPDGYLATIDRTNGYVAVSDPETLSLRSYQSLGGDHPGDIAVAADGSLWVPTCDGHLWQVPRSGAYVQAPAKRASFDGAGCTGTFGDAPPIVAISPFDDSIWVANPDKHKVYRYLPSSNAMTEVTQFDKGAPAAGPIINSLQVDSMGFVYVGYAGGGLVFNPLAGKDAQATPMTVDGSSTLTSVGVVTMTNGDIGALVQSGGKWLFGAVGSEGIMASDAATVALKTLPSQLWSSEQYVMPQLVVAPSGDISYSIIDYVNVAGVLVQFNPASGDVTEYPFDPAGATFEEINSRLLAFTSSGLAWIAGTNTGRLAMMTSPASGSAPCTATGTVPVDKPIMCTAILDSASTVTAATYNEVDGPAVRGADWVPGPNDVGHEWTGSLTFTSPGIATTQQRTIEPFTVATQTITAVTPLTGPDEGGTEITISGTGFQSGMNVFLTSDPSTEINVVADDVEVVSPTTITAVMPAKGEDVPERTPLWVGFGWTDPDDPNYLAESPQKFSYGGALPPTPVITSVTPDEIAAGTSGQTVSIDGQYFTKLMKVSFNGVPATTQTFVSSTHLTAVVPPGLPVATGELVLDPGYDLPVGTAPFTVTGPSTLTAISPTTGSIDGGEPVVLTGTGFNEYTQVLVDGTPLPLSSGLLEGSTAQRSITMPAHAAGTVDVAVQNSGFPVSTLHNAFTYLSASVTGLSPTSGPNTGGESVAITGSGLEDVRKVLFRQSGQPDLVAPLASPASDTKVTVVVPASPVSGTAKVVLEMVDGSTATAPSPFTYTGIPAPTLATMDVTGGRVGTSYEVTVRGTGFMPNATFALGAAQASSVSVGSGGTSATMVFDIAAPPGVQDLVVTNPNGASATLSHAFNAYGGVTITSVDPTTGTTAGGTTVTVTGSGFTSDMEVNFAGYTGLPFSVLSATELTFVTPAHAQGAADLTILNGDLTDSATLPNAYWYQTPTPTAMSLTAMDPVSGDPAGGNTVTLTGTGFTNACLPEIGMVNTPGSNVRIVDAQTMTFTMLPGAAGVVDVWVHCANPSGRSLDSQHLQYSYAGPASITSVSPGVGALAGGNTVTVTGTAFAADVQVTFGGRPARVTQVSWHGSQASVVVPAGVAAGAVDVVVANPGSGPATLANGYTYQPGPTVTSVTPAQGPTSGGTLVVIDGTGFQAGAGVIVKALNDVAPATAVSVRSGTSMTATLPAFTPGIVDIVVQNPDGTSVVGTNAFTYDDTPGPVNTPTITSLSPNTGPTSGGTDITILGADFESAQCVVAFGGVPATTQSFVATTRMTATTPAGNAGTVDVTVTCPTAGQGLLNNGFTYEGAPTVTGVVPGSGSASGGTTVALTGAGFAANATVFFGSVEAASVVVNSATSITAVTDANTAGPVDVVVTNPGLGSATMSDAFTFIADPSPTPSPTDTPSPTPSPTDTPSPTPSPTGTPSPSPSPTDSPAPAPAPAPGPAAPPPPPPISTPAIAAVTPFVGPVSGGTTITISGSSFQPGATVFVEGVQAAGVAWQASTQVTAVTPGGPPGAADVTVVNPDGGRAVLDNAFTYESPPAVASLDVRTGPVVGGTTVTISGTGFASDATVQFGSAAAQNVQVVDGSHIVAVTPTGKLGWNTVTVTNPGVDSFDLPDGFDFEWAQQLPAKAIVLPKVLTANRWTSVVRLPVVTNVGQRLKATVTCVPVKSCEVRTHNRHLEVKAGRAREVTVRLTAPPEYQDGYGGFRLDKVYGTKQIRSAA